MKIVSMISSNYCQSILKIFYKKRRVQKYVSHSVNYRDSKVRKYLGFYR
jgi:hypothetical protein